MRPFSSGAYLSTFSFDDFKTARKEREKMRPLYLQSADAPTEQRQPAGVLLQPKVILNRAANVKPVSAAYENHEDTFAAVVGIEVTGKFPCCRFLASPVKMRPKSSNRIGNTSQSDINFGSVSLAKLWQSPLRSSSVARSGIYATRLLGASVRTEGAVTCRGT
jgi:hypothetical protein